MSPFTCLYVLSGLPPPPHLHRGIAWLSLRWRRSHVTECQWGHTPLGIFSLLVLFPCKLQFCRVLQLIVSVRSVAPPPPVSGMCWEWERTRGSTEEVEQQVRINKHEHVARTHTGGTWHLLKLHSSSLTHLKLHTFINALISIVSDHTPLWWCSRLYWCRTGWRPSWASRSLSPWAAPTGRWQSPRSGSNRFCPCQRRWRGSGRRSMHLRRRGYEVSVTAPSLNIRIGTSPNIDSRQQWSYKCFRNDESGLAA